MYLDRRAVPGASAEDLASAHAADVGVQQNHDVRYLTYWFDPAAQTVFCLAEGPSRDAVEAGGATVQLAARLCGVAPPGGVTASVAVRELCIGKLIRFEEREPLNLGGFSEAVRCFDVAC